MPLNKVTLQYNGKTIELDVLKGTEGQPVIDGRDLESKIGLLFFDPGFTATASCESTITFIDGNKGKLLYRGYKIEDLAKECNFLEVAYLLLYGELPNQSSIQNFTKKITTHSLVHEQLIKFYSGFRRDAHPMAIMVAVVGALSAFFHDSLDIRDAEQREIATYRLLAKIPNLAAMAYKYSLGHPFNYPQNDLSYSANLLRMMFAIPCEEYQVNPVIEKAMDRILILHADHEQNASTSTVRLAGSSSANPFACIASGIAALWGPAHGGANEAVLNMLAQIGSVDKIPEYITRAKDPNDKFRLMGFGHRVYKNYDPRAKILRETCYEVLDALDMRENTLFKLALELEKIALNDEYFIEKKLYPNVDFYSGIILRAMGVPVSMFTVLFAVARSVGWIAHWREMIADPKQKIGRPRQLYIGSRERSFIKMEARI